MIVCLCKSVSDRDIAGAIAKGASTVEEIAQCTGAGTGCGTCRDSIRCTLERGTMARAEQPQLVALRRSLAAIVT